MTSSPWPKWPESGTTGGTACPTKKDQQFTKLVQQSPETNRHQKLTFIAN
jgi:hypothetical protein